MEKIDQQNLNDEEILLELIEVRQIQENSYLSSEEMSEDDVDYILENAKEDYPVEILKVKTIEAIFITADAVFKPKIINMLKTVL